MTEPTDIPQRLREYADRTICHDASVTEAADELEQLWDELAMQRTCRDKDLSLIESLRIETAQLRSQLEAEKKISAAQARLLERASKELVRREPSPLQEMVDAGLRFEWHPVQARVIGSKGECWFVTLELRDTCMTQDWRDDIGHAIVRLLNGPRVETKGGAT